MISCNSSWTTDRRIPTERRIEDELPLLSQTIVDLYIDWLVVLTILKHISQLGLLFPIYGKITNVPNHQPAYI